MNSLKLMIIIICALSMGCHSHVLTQKTEVSRDHVFISFENLKTPYTRSGEVGGEYMSLTKIIAFQGDHYKVEVTPESPDLKLWVGGPGVKEIENNGQSVVVSVEDVFETFC